MRKKLPEFKSEDSERRFWATADSTEFVDWASGKRTKLVDLKPSLKTISLRLPVSMIQDLKVLANRRDVPYQSLLKVFLAERLAQERQTRSEQTQGQREGMGVTRSLGGEAMGKRKIGQKSIG